MANKLTVGVKDDKSKLKIELIPPEVIVALAKVLEYGAIKYEARNFEKGIHFSRLWAAAQRHLWSYWGGEIYDESGMPHLYHALCSVAMLVTLTERDMVQFDDRPVVKVPGKK
jgi:hypothetical protein